MFKLIIALLLWTFLTTPLTAEVRISGQISITNMVTGFRQPLVDARVRVVLEEYLDLDTLDEETTTDSNGHYEIRTDNPWFRAGYDAQLVVVAEAPGFLEVQQFYLQVDGYQARSQTFFAKQDETTVMNLHIDGSQDSVLEYEAGGILALDNGDDVSASQGRQGFHIFQEMTDHRRLLQQKGIPEEAFEEKEVSYPVDQELSDYTRLDYIRIRDDLFQTGGPRGRTTTLRHELSHGLMNDTLNLRPGFYEAVWEWLDRGILPSLFHAIFEETQAHKRSTEYENEACAWIEAWAIFLAEVTVTERYGNGLNDLEIAYNSDGNHWYDFIEPHQKRHRIEGEIAAALWDIYDPVGLELSRFRSDDTPEDEVFFDGIEDPNLTKIWYIFDRFHPLSFTHGKFLGDHDSLIYRWRFDTDFGQEHELKTILANRGIIYDDVFSEAGLALRVDEESWEGATATLEGHVIQPDPESIAFNRVSLFLNGQLMQEQQVGSQADSSRVPFSFQQDIFHRLGKPLPQVLITVHDDLNLRTVETQLTPPEDITYSGLNISFTGVKVYNKARIDSDFVGADIPDFDNHRPEDEQTLQPGVSPSAEALEDLVLHFSAEATGDSVTRQIPAQTGWTVAKDDTFKWFFFQEILRTRPLADETMFTVTARGRSGGAAFEVSKETVFREANNFGAGPHQMIIPLNDGLGAPYLRVSFVVELRTLGDENAKGIAPLDLGQLASDWLSRTPSDDPFRRTWEEMEGKPRPRPIPPIAPTRPKSNGEKKVEKTHPAQLLTRAHRLLEAHARLQEDIGEMAQTLRWRLDPERRSQLRKGAKVRQNQAFVAKSKVVVPKAKFNRNKFSPKKQLSKGQPKTLLTKNVTAFLADASQGRLRLSPIPAAHGKVLTNWRTRHRRLMKKLAEQDRELRALRAAWPKARSHLTEKWQGQVKHKRQLLEALAKAEKQLAVLDRNTLEQTGQDMTILMKQMASKP